MQKGLKIVSLIVAIATLVTQLLLALAAVFQAAVGTVPSTETIGVPHNEYYIMPLLFVGVGLGFICALFLVINVTTDILTIQSHAVYYKKSNLMYALLFLTLVFPFLVALLFKTLT